MNSCILDASLNPVIIFKASSLEIHVFLMQVLIALIVKMLQVYSYINFRIRDASHKCIIIQEHLQLLVCISYPFICLIDIYCLYRHFMKFHIYIYSICYQYI